MSCHRPSPLPVLLPSNLKWVMLSMLALCLQGVRPSALRAQTPDTLQTALYVVVNRVGYQGDSIPNVTLGKFYRFSPMKFKNERERENYNRMVNTVKYVYPYAQLAKQTLIETYDFLETLPDEASRKAHIAAVEKGIKEQYTPLVRKLTRSQGKLLVKLIDRECGQTSFEMVKAFLGPLKANIYQVAAGLFGNSLTKHYDPEGDDRHTERIIRMLESGQL